MTTQITEPATRPICEQRAAAEALVALTELLGGLPGGYIKIHQPFQSLPAELHLQFNSPQALEEWRAALEIAPSNVSLHAAVDADMVWLTASTVFHGVPMEMTGHGVPLAADVAKAPQVADEPSAVAA